MRIESERRLAEPSVTTAIPGPRSRVLLERQERRESSAEPIRARHLPIALRRGAGASSRTWTATSSSTSSTGAGVLSLGHNHPSWWRATEPARRVRARAGLPDARQGRVHRAAARDAAGRDAGAASSCTSAARRAPTRVEAAIKLCKIATGRGDIVAFQGGFHGTTPGGDGDVTGPGREQGAGPERDAGRALLPVLELPALPARPAPGRCDDQLRDLPRVGRCNDPNGGIPKPAAVMLELVQGEGGSIPARLEFVRRLRDITRRLDIPLIVDEVQTGCGRTRHVVRLRAVRHRARRHRGVEGAVSGLGLPVAVHALRRGSTSGRPARTSARSAATSSRSPPASPRCGSMRRDDVLGNVRERGRRSSRGRLAALAARSDAVVGRARARVDVGRRPRRPGGR